MRITRIEITHSHVTIFPSTFQNQYCLGLFTTLGLVHREPFPIRGGWFTNIWYVRIDTWDDMRVISEIDRDKFLKALWSTVTLKSWEILREFRVPSSEFRIPIVAEGWDGKQNTRKWLIFERNQFLKAFRSTISLKSWEIEMDFLENWSRDSFERYLVGTRFWRVWRISKDWTKRFFHTTLEVVVNEKR
jgi:hypothetical protein